MTQGVNTVYLLPDPDLVSRNIAHRRQEIQVNTDALNRLREQGAKMSEPFTARKAIGQLHPLIKSTIQEIA